MGPDPAAVTDDAVLGGRLRLLQPARGHRVGHDAVLLAAAVPAAAGLLCTDLGAGVGAAGLAVARRIADARVTLVEIDPRLAALAAENARRNALADRLAVVCADVAALPLAAGGCDVVLANPPFNDPARHRASPDPARERAHVATLGLDAWVAAARRLLRPGGTLVLIHRADALGDVLPALAGFGGVSVLPVQPRGDAPAIRVLVRARLGSRAPLVLLPPLALDGPLAGAVVRDAAALPPA